MRDTAKVMLCSLCSCNLNVPFSCFIESAIRNSKLGTRPKGGSPKDKSAIRNLLCPLPSALCLLHSAIRIPQSEIIFPLPYAPCL